MKNFIYKIWQALRSWIQNQEKDYENLYIIGICKRFHGMFPKYSFKCYRTDNYVFILEFEDFENLSYSPLDFLYNEYITLNYILPHLTLNFTSNNSFKNSKLIYAID